MSLCFHSIAHAHRMRSKIEDDPDFFEGLTLTGEYESLGKLASRTYVVLRWLGDEDQTAERLCYDVCRTRSFEWLSEIHQPISTNTKLRFTNRPLPIFGAAPHSQEWRRPDGVGGICCE